MQDDAPRMKLPSPYLHIFVNPDPTPKSSLKFKSSTQISTENPVWPEHFNMYVRERDRTRAHALTRASPPQ